MDATPRGFRDILPEEALEREAIADGVRAIFSQGGYVPVETPLLENRAVLERAGRLKGAPFQLIDADDDVLMVRPDLTMPIARLVATRMDLAGLPLRLRYQAPVVREQRGLAGQERQFTQLGVELVGAEDGAAETEVVGLLAKVLEGMGVEGWRIVCGSVRPLEALLAPVPEPLHGALREAIHDTDLVALDALVDGADLEPALAEAIKGFCRLQGGIEVLDRLQELLTAAGVPQDRSGVDGLRAMVESLDGTAAEGRVAFDFSIVNSFDYYTGLVFKAYVPSLASSLASGGRYDAVLANLAVEAVGACGFALSLERLQEALGATSTDSEKRPLRIAVPKGGLFKPTVDALEAAGLPVGALRDPGRHLIVAEEGVEYVIVRATDAPAFVAHGGADCGICGVDSLVEADLDLVQLADLGYGRCHFVVAEPRSRAGEAEAAYARRGSVRVATKYPRITRAYYESIGRPVDIVALHGNIELGPIVGMADRIVDITATGTTLRENDLVVVDDDILECTARFFAGPAAYRCDSRISALAQALERAQTATDEVAAPRSFGA